MTTDFSMIDDLDSEQHRLLLHNRFGCPQDLWIEPWGEKIVLKPNSSYLLIGKGPPRGSLEFELRPDGHAVYGWSRSTLKIVDEEKNVVWFCPVPAP